jgi:cell wall-associated NlpC family hydrolase
MHRRNILIYIGLLSGLAACGSAPPVPPERSSRGPGDHPGRDDEAVDPLDAMLAADPDPRRNDVITVALSQVGTPYFWGGRSPVIGFDCSGLVAYVFQQALHLALPRLSYDQARLGHAVAGDALRPADLVFFNTLRREFSHVGIYIGRDRFVHAPLTGSFVRIERITGDYWRSRYDGGRRVLV